MGLLPAALYGLRVPAGEVMVPAAIDFPATIRITMAAIDPTEEPEVDENGKVPRVPRSTLKIIKEALMPDDDSDDGDYLQDLLANDDDSEDESDPEANGGPSDPSKSKKARQEAAIKKLLAAAQDEDEDEEMADVKTNGKKSKSKGKAPATEEDDEEEEDSDDEDDSELGANLEDHVLCTLDLERNLQQTLDIVIGEGEKAYFLVSGTHSIHLTGNYVIPDVEENSDDDSDDDYDLTPDMEDVIGDGESVSSDDLDDIDSVLRVEEIDTEEKAPKLIKAKDSKKGKKRAAEEEVEGLDEIIAQAAEGKLSKKQLKKLKNNKGEAVVAEAKTKDEKSTPAKGDKKVQFAKNLEQGPTGSAEKAKAEIKGSANVKVVQGVTIDDRKVGQGRVAKSGDKVSMRYIGKLTNGKVFDANKKGPPFSFKLGKGEVIKGWDIGVAGMSVGGERRLTIPPSHAYGSAGVPGIPGNCTLIFDVKLMEIK